ncbi:hypothetical protein F4679DRAFT_522886 [Xylaria curta]|nr:hypothetical protein F4679DRAFT_522886 [Xylaria curta]
MTMSSSCACRTWVLTHGSGFMLCSMFSYLLAYGPNQCWPRLSTLSLDADRIGIGSCRSPDQSLSSPLHFTSSRLRTGDVTNLLKLFSSARPTM